MLQSLHIKDFILIKKLDLEFKEGFSVITGQTGAGKSILLDSILFALGGKFSNDPVRPSAEKCSVSIVFSKTTEIENHLAEIDIEIENDDDLIIKRVQTSSGRKKFFLNDQLVTAKLLQNLFNYLLELHGQHNHTLLMDSKSHMRILDEFAKLGTLKQQTSKLYYDLQECTKQIELFEQNKQAIANEIEYLEHICTELEEANIYKGEEEELVDIKKNIQNYDKERKIITDLLQDIEHSSIGQVVLRSQRIIADSENKYLTKIDTDLEQIYDKVETVKSSLQNCLQELEMPEHSLEEIDDRLYLIRSLARKHNSTVDELGNFLKKSKEKLDRLQSQISDSAKLEEKMLIAKSDYSKIASNLSKKRQEAAEDLSEKVMQELKYLDMKKAQFQITVDADQNNISANGIDEVRFVASTNPGMELSQIDKIASGGELSRFMLSLRVALFDNAPKQTIIFDEIDVGISGSVADSIGERLKSLSKVVQIIVITHQPQVAGKADQHILVEKQQHESHTSVNINTLKCEEKPYELARMISGKKITKAGIEAAKELI